MAPPESRSDREAAALQAARAEIEAANNSDERVIALQGLEKALGFRRFIPGSETRETMISGRSIAAELIEKDFWGNKPDEDPDAVGDPTKATYPGKTYHEASKKDLDNYKRALGRGAMFGRMRTVPGIKSEMHVGARSRNSRTETYNSMRDHLKGSARIRAKREGTKKEEDDWKARTDAGKQAMAKAWDDLYIDYAKDKNDPTKKKNKTYAESFMGTAQIDPSLVGTVTETNPDDGTTTTRTVALEATSQAYLDHLKYAHGKAGTPRDPTDRKPL